MTNIEQLKMYLMRFDIVKRTIGTDGWISPKV